MARRPRSIHAYLPAQPHQARRGIVHHRDMPIVRPLPQLGRAAVMRQPFAVRRRHHAVAHPVHEQRRTGDARAIEAPRRHVGDIVIDQAVDPLGHRRSHHAVEPRPRPRQRLPILGREHLGVEFEPERLMVCLAARPCAAARSAAAP